MNKKTIKKYLNKKSTNNPYIELLESFEKRLDTVLYRSKFCFSIRNAQQLIVHGNVYVNAKKIKTKSYKLKFGDLITINPIYYKLIEENIRQVQIWPIPPKHLHINYKTLQIIYGSIDHTNISTIFTFHLNLEKIINNKNVYLQ